MFKRLFANLIDNSHREYGDEILSCRLDRVDDYTKALKITPKVIEIYGDTKFEDLSREIVMDEICGIYINRKKDQFMLKLPDIPNELFYTKECISLVRAILSTVPSNNIPIYKLPKKELSRYVEKTKLPNSKYLVNEDMVDLNSSIEVSTDLNDSHQEILDQPHQINSTFKVPQKVGDTDKNQGRFTEKHEAISTKDNSDEQDNENENVNDNSTDGTEEEIKSARLELNKNKSTCMITQISLDNFTLIKIIGVGAFGRVFLAKDDKGKVYAMKRIRKDKVLQCDAVENILLERKILSEIDHPLLLQLRHAFATDCRFYFFTDFIMGGDLMKHMKKIRKGFSLPQVKFIAAQLVLAFECLHENDIVHRDLKPENVLIDEEGYIKLADFGLAKDLSEGLGTGSCGTLEYMAPEILDKSASHNKEVDWWTLGVLIYELFYGRSPFVGATRSIIIDNIKHNEVEFPDKKADDLNSLKALKSLIKKLLKKDPTKRLGYSKKGHGAKKIKKHPFFKRINWAKILDRSYVAPYVPNINTDKVDKYLKKQGCKVGTPRRDHFSKYGKLAESDLDNDTRMEIKKHEKLFKDNE